MRLLAFLGMLVALCFSAYQQLSSSVHAQQCMMCSSTLSRCSSVPVHQSPPDAIALPCMCTAVMVVHCRALQARCMVCLIGVCV
jgi:hypothetical protein